MIYYVRKLSYFSSKNTNKLIKEFKIKDLDKDFDEDLLMKLMYIYTLANRNSNEFNN